jgi:hypothetical protein
MMTRSDAFQFLDIPENTDAKRIVSRWQEKYNFFKMLHTNAPNQLIRDLQQKNLEKLEEIKNILLPTQSIFEPPAPGPNHEPHIKPHVPSKPNSVSPNNPVAWLVVHTENKTTRSFPLFEGETVVGRDPSGKKNTIVLADDQYVSRYHCSFIIAGNNNETSVVVVDDGHINNGKTSKNGTFVNGSDDRILVRQLNENDTIQVGYTKMVFKWDENKGKKHVEEEVRHTEFIKTVVIDL